VNHPQDYPLRHALNDEVHARPAPVMAPPLRASHIAVVSGEGSERGERAHIAELCALFGASPPPITSNFWSAALGRIQLRWERHTEFSTYTFAVAEPFTEPFAAPVIAEIPDDWLAAIPGQRLVAINLAIEPAAASAARDAAALAALFSSDIVVASRVGDGMATVWTDFRIAADGFSRVLVRDDGLDPRRAGRLLQRLLEIETYRMMALLAFPLARGAAARLARIDRRLVGLTEQLSKIEGLEDEKALLTDLTRLAGEVEQLSSANAYRFSAARAYDALVQRRVSELREERFEGRQTIGGFLDRRLAPAMRTCHSVAERQEVLSQRIARAGELLRTRVDVALEGQNRDLLATMARRARLQLLLQETVEGLSVVAITYYVVGLVGYAAEAAALAVTPFDVHLVQGLSIPLVAAAVWFAARRVRRALRQKDEADTT